MIYIQGRQIERKRCIKLNGRGKKLEGGKKIINNKFETVY